MSQNDSNKAFYLTLKVRSKKDDKKLLNTLKFQLIQKF